jgi:hypothetical protein
MSAFYRWVAQKVEDPSRSVLLTHTHVDPGVPLEDPMETVGLVDRVPVEVFRPWGVVVAGHLHRPQQIPESRVWYPGSLLKYHPQEHAHTKGVLEIRWYAERPAPEVELRPLPQPVDFWVVRGRVEGTTFRFSPASPPPPEGAQCAVVQAVLDAPVGSGITLRDAVMDACRARVPDMELVWGGTVDAGTPIVSGEEMEDISIQDAAPLELVQRYLEERGYWVAWDEPTRKAILGLMEELLEEPHEAAEA